jgi:spermidine/putrescine transport system ATP-binding protein
VTDPSTPAASEDPSADEPAPTVAAAPRVTPAPADDRTSTTAAAVELIDVTKRFGEVTAVDGMNLRIDDGQFYSFLGPSGCGKTTTLRMIAGFEQPTAGEILLEGRPVQGVPPYRRNVNTVFQHYALFPHMSVAENVGYGLRQRNVGKAEQTRRVGEALELIRLEGYARRRTWELSGGQQQRVALARALINRPAVLLLDEPLGALDRKLRHEMQIELKAIQHEVEITFVYVTHDQEEALTMSDIIVVMRDGRIQQQGRPDALYLRPVNRFVAGFIGSSNFLDARLTGRDGSTDRARVAIPAGPAFGGRLTDPSATLATDASVTVAIRPECVILSPSDAPPPADGPGWSRLTGRVVQGTYLGDQSEYKVAVPQLGELIVRRQNEGLEGDYRTFGPGEAVTVGWHEDSTLLLTS